jgi:hypothetical protein
MTLSKEEKRGGERRETRCGSRKDKGCSCYITITWVDYAITWD